MCLARFKKTARLESPESLHLLVQALIILSVCTVTIQGQRQPAVPARDVVRTIQRQEMDLLLLRKLLPAAKDDASTRAVLKQIRDDFKDMQRLNNKMMAEAWAREALDYQHISDMVSQIRSKAARLKSNLSLPEAEPPEKSQMRTETSSAKEFRAALLLFDKSVISFATNPLFQQSNIVEVKSANQASRDLAAVIELSGKLKKVALRLSKTVKASQ
jgi:hypothetical protein